MLYASKYFYSNQPVQIKSMVSCQKSPTHHAQAWRKGPFWQDTLEVCSMIGDSPQRSLECMPLA